MKIPPLVLTNMDRKDLTIDAKSVPHIVLFFIPHNNRFQEICAFKIIIY